MVGSDPVARVVQGMNHSYRVAYPKSGEIEQN